MSKIRIKNFGPIKEGYVDENGVSDFIDIKKVTVFIGDQGTGKSTIAKLFSTFCWLEKAINRGDIRLGLRGADIQDAIRWQGITSYMSDISEIEYIGNAYNIEYVRNETDPLKGIPIVKKSSSDNYVVPKIMYVPAERNFLSTIKGAYDVTGLPGPLVVFAEELKRAQLELNGQPLNLPVRDYSYEYDEYNDTSHILGSGYNINLLEASSGLQSFIPLYLVSRNLSSVIAQSSGNGGGNISVNQLIRRNEEITNITLDNAITEEEKKLKVNRIFARYHSKCFVNIVEEPEQNLFPVSQKHILNNLLEFANTSDSNELIITTHSPYIINFLSIAIQGGYLKQKIGTAVNSNELLKKLYDIIPEKSTIRAEDVVIYELKDGKIIKLPTYEGIPSDKNYLNQSLADGNRLFDSLLEIEEEL